MAPSMLGRGSRPDRALGWFKGWSVAGAHTPTAPPALRNGAVPRLWTVFAAYLGVLAAVSWLVFVAGGILGPWLGANVAFFAILVLAQVATWAAAIIPAWLSREPVRTRLGLIRPGLPTWGYSILALASFAPWAVGALLGVGVELLTGPGWGSLIREPMPWELAVPLVLFAALGPGFLEELLFRGYIQRRLLQRWSPPVAILVSSLLFAVMHLDPGQSAAAFVFGLWVGVLAWRTGSVWPGILCHAVINGTVYSFRLVELAGDPSSVVVTLLQVVWLAGLLGLFALGLASFPLAVWLITRRREAEPRALGLPQPVAA